MYDVLIIGAGPLGSYVARRLASLNYKVLVIEEHPKVGEPAWCTGIVGAECFDTFPVPQQAILRGACSAKFISPSGRVVALHREKTQAYIVDRAAFDRALAEQAQVAGAEYLLGHRVKQIKVLESAVIAEVDGQSERNQIKSKTAVIAAGFNCRLPEQLGLGRITDSMTGAQAEVTGPGLEEVEIYFGQSVAPGFFAWLVPTSRDKALAGLFSQEKPGVYLGDFLDSLQQQGKITSADVKFTYGGIPLRPLAKSYRERVLVIGGAAGQVKPTTGGGIYYGLLCAEIATDILHQALSQNDFSREMFSQYERRWKGLIMRELQIGYFARKIYQRLNDRQIDRVFDIVQSSGLHKLLMSEDASQFDWHGDLILRGLGHHAVGAALGLFWDMLPLQG